jgi:DNA-binding transcriptional LysR family regulator
MDRLAAMKAFVAVADAQGFAPAASKLALSPSVVTRLVAGLEHRLGIRLLQRTTRSVTLTDAGTRYLVRARRILADVEEAEESALAERGVPTGRLVVTAPMMFGRLHVSPLMCRYLDAHPHVIGELSLSDRNANLVEDGIDVAVRIGQLPDSSLVARKAGSTRRVVVASPQYLARHGIPVTPAELASHRTIQFTALAPFTDWSFARDGQGIRVAVSSHYATNSADAALWHAERDGGLTLALSYQAAEAVQQGRLQIVLGDFEPEAMPIHFVYPTSRLLSAKVRSFIDLAAETCDWNF